MRTINIYFEDLNEEKQNEHRKDFEGCINVNSPIAIIDLEDEEGGDNE